MSAEPQPDQQQPSDLRPRGRIVLPSLDHEVAIIKHGGHKRHKHSAHLSSPSSSSDEETFNNEARPPASAIQEQQPTTVKQQSQPVSVFRDDSNEEIDLDYIDDLIPCVLSQDLMDTTSSSTTSNNSPLSMTTTPPLTPHELVPMLPLNSPLLSPRSPPVSARPKAMRNSPPVISIQNTAVTTMPLLTVPIIAITPAPPSEDTSKYQTEDSSPKFPPPLVDDQSIFTENRPSSRGTQAFKPMVPLALDSMKESPSMENLSEHTEQQPKPIASTSSADQVHSTKDSLRVSRSDSPLPELEIGDSIPPVPSQQVEEKKPVTPTRKPNFARIKRSFRSVMMQKSILKHMEHHSHQDLPRVKICIRYPPNTPEQGIRKISEATSR